MRRRVIFSPEARSDLIRLYEWIAERAEENVALGYIERLETHCLSFEIFSHRGRRRDDIRKGLRIVGAERRMTIAFVVEPDVVIILRLYYGGKNWP